MTSLATKSNQNRRLSLNEKLKVFAGCGAVAAVVSGAPAVSEADIVQSTTAPIGTVANAFNGRVATDWDVDSDGTNDFSLIKYNSTFITSSFTYLYGSASFDDLNGGRLVVPSGLNSDGISKLPLGVNIGPTLNTAYKFHGNAQNVNTITSYILWKCLYWQRRKSRWLATGRYRFLRLQVHQRCRYSLRLGRNGNLQ